MANKILNTYYMYVLRIFVRTCKLTIICLQIKGPSYILWGTYPKIVYLIRHVTSGLTLLCKHALSETYYSNTYHNWLWVWVNYSSFISVHSYLLSTMNAHNCLCMMTGSITVQVLVHKRMSIFNLWRFVYNLRSFKQMFI